MSIVFTSIMPETKETLIASMSIFAVTMGSLVGTPGTIIEYFKVDIKKSFKSSNIPLWVIPLTSFVSSFVNLLFVCLIIFVTAPIFFEAEKPLNILMYFSSYALFLVATLCLGIILGLYSKSVSKLTMYSQLVFLPSMMLSGIMFPAEMLPSFLRYIGLIFPATHGMKLLSGETVDFFSVIFLVLIIVISLFLIIIKLKKLKYENA
jgi:ABC-2 type transport system permease protein